MVVGNRYFFLVDLGFGGTTLEKARTTRILIHEHLSDACELVQSGQLLQYRDYSAVVIDGTSSELCSLELSPTSFIEEANGTGRGIKAASNAGFVVKVAGMSIPAFPSVVATVTGAKCPQVQDAVTLVANQRGSRRTSIQAKVYRPGFDNVTRPVPEASSKRMDAHPTASSNAMPPPDRPKVKHGTVVLAAVVGPDGTVTDTKVVRSLEPWLDVKAMEEVRTWRFQPARKQGLPVAAVIDVMLDFNLH